MGTQLFFERGFDGTSVQELVDAASLTKGALYHHFRSKEELLFEIQLTQVRIFNDRITTIVSTHDDPESTLRAIVGEMLRLVAEYRREIAIFFSERRFITQHDFAVIQAERDQFERTITAVIQDGIEAGVFRPVASPRILAFGLIGMSAWAYQWYSSAGGHGASEIGAMYADTVLDGLLSPRPGARAGFS